jgi:hypothetical protein
MENNGGGGGGFKYVQRPLSKAQQKKVCLFVVQCLK